MMADAVASTPRNVWIFFFLNLRNAWNVIEVVYWLVCFMVGLYHVNFFGNLEICLLSCVYNVELIVEFVRTWFKFSEFNLFNYVMVIPCLHFFILISSAWPCTIGSSITVPWIVNLLQYRLVYCCQDLTNDQTNH